MKKQFFSKLCLLVVLALIVCTCVVLCACEEEQAPITVSLDRQTANLEEYRTLKLTATSEASVTGWTSSDEAVATVSANGTVTAVAQGETTITVTVEGGQTASCVVTVVPTSVQPVLTVSQSEIVVAQDGEGFEVSVLATWDGKQFTESVAYTWEISQGKADDLLVITPDESTSKATVEGIKQGETEITVSATIRGKLASKTIKVTVTETKVVLDITTGEHIAASQQQGAGYLADLTLIATDSSVVELPIAISATYGKTDVTESVQFTSVIDDEDIVSYQDGKITALALGEATLKITATYTTATQEEKTAEVEILVTVSRAQIAWADTSFTVENTNLQPLDFSGKTIEGTVQNLLLGEREILDAYSASATTLKNLPTKTAEGMGDGLQATLVTDKAEYSFIINLYTKILKTKEDIDGMGAVAAAVTNDAAGNIPTTWDGYFVLGNDIAYNGEYNSMFGKGNIWNANGDRNALDKRGFKGVFDGHGYNIDGMIISKNTFNDQPWGFIPTMMVGSAIKNVSFTNAQALDTSFLSAYFGGLVENVHVQFVKITGDKNVAGLVGAGQLAPGGNISKVYDSVIDVSGAEIIGNVVILGHPGEMANSGVIESDNVFIIGNEAVGGKKHKDGTIDQDIVFASYAQAKASEDFATAIATLSDKYWTIANGLPIFNGLVDESELALANEPATLLNSGEVLEVAFNKHFVAVSFTKDGEACNLVYANGKVTIPDDVSAVGSYVMTAVDAYGESSVTHEFAVKYVKNTTINQDVDFNYSSTDGSVGSLKAGITEVKFDLSAIANDLGEIESLKYGATEIKDVEGISLSGSELKLPLSVFGYDYGEKTLVLKSKKDGAEFNTTFNLVLITKVLKTKDDLDTAWRNIGRAFARNKNGTDGDVNNQWDGYYVLGNDIAYNGIYAGMIGTEGYKTDPTRFGFRGVLDGRGHTIDGMGIKRQEGQSDSVNTFGFLGTIMGSAVVKNISFTNASVENCAFFAQKVGAGATFKNIYIQYKSFVATTNCTATFSPTSNIGAANVNKAGGVFIDGSKIETFTKETSLGWAAARLVDRDATFNNPTCYAVGNQVVTAGDSTGESAHILAADVATFKAKAGGEYNVSTWDMTYWEVAEDGRMLPKTLSASLR